MDTRKGNTKKYMILKNPISTPVEVSILFYWNSNDLPLNEELFISLSDNILSGFPNRPTYHFTKGSV